MRPIAVVIWSTIPPLLLSALFHSTDSDVGGVAGLESPKVLLSVAIFALPLVLVVWLSRKVLLRFGPFAGAASLMSCAGAISAVIVRYGSTASSLADLAWRFLGTCLVVCSFLFVALLPRSPHRN